MKIFFYALRPYDELPYVDQFSKETGIEYGWTADYPNKDNMELCRGSDVFSCIPCDMSAPVIDKLADLGIKWIACRSIGYNHVDLEECRKKGIRVSNVAYPPESVADYAIMCLLMGLRKASHILKRSEAQDYSLKGKIGREISFLTVGVIGTGRIGTTLIRHLSGFGCRILCYDPYPNKTASQYATYTDLDTLLKEADAITLHANVTKENTHLLNDDAFHKMKDGVLIVNTSRGLLIDTDALVKAITSGKVGSAVLDVLEDENGLYFYNRTGDVIDNKDMALLRSFPNVTLLPHTAFYTEASVKAMVEGCFQGAIACRDNTKTPLEIL